MKSYTYNASDADHLDFFRGFTSRNGDGEGDFEEDLLSALALAAACKADGAFLDVGSGLGRIVEAVKGHARTVTGLEPDEARFADCKNRFRGEDQIEILKTTTGEYRAARPDRRFDLVTVSMVLQHVSTGACDQILADVRELLAPNGVALIATTHFFEERFTYQVETFAHPRDEYDRYAEHPQSQDKGIPVRMFSKDSFLETVENAGLETIAWKQFSYARPERLESIAWVYSAPAEGLRDRGISQYALVKRAAR